MIPIRRHRRCQQPRLRQQCQRQVKCSANDISDAVTNKSADHPAYAETERRIDSESKHSPNGKSQCGANNESKCSTDGKSNSNAKCDIAVNHAVTNKSADYPAYAETERRTDSESKPRADGKSSCGDTSGSGSTAANSHRLFGE